MSSSIRNEIDRLQYENILWIIFIVIAVLNIIGDYEEQQLLITNNQLFGKKANKIFTITIIVTLAIYFYFIKRNATAFKEAKLCDKENYFIKLLGSSFLIAGAICLLYFQSKNNNFMGSPSS